MLRVWKTRIPLILSGIIIVFASFVSVWEIRGYNSAALQMDRSLKLHSELDEVMAGTVALELQHRDALLAGRPVVKADAQIANLLKNLNELEAMVDSEGKQRTQHIRELIRNHLLYKPLGIKADPIIHAIKNEIDAIGEREDARLANQSRKIYLYSSFGIPFVVVTSLTTLLLLAVFAFWVYRENVRRNQTEGELKNAEEAAMVASKMKSQFLATISHEIRTPLNGILGISDILTRRRLPPQELHLVETLHKSSETLLRIVNDILDFAKIEAGKIEIEYTPFKMREWAKSSFDLFVPMASKKGLGFSIEIKPNTFEYWIGDPRRIGQVLNNLINNAIKFTPAGSVRVTIGSENNGRSMLWVEIEDQGPGLDKEQIKYLFEPFNQVHNRRPDGEDGTGLGLSIAKNIVAKMGGEIGVQSTPHQGSKFWFRLPLRRKNDIISEGALLAIQGAACPENEVEAPPNGAFDFGSLMLPGNPLILVAEDNPTNLLVTTELIRELKGRVITAVDGQQAIEQFHKYPDIDLILMDCQMPVVDGYMATKTIRELEKERTRKTPIIALTAKVRATDKEECLSCGMDDFLAKPITKGELAQTISKWILTPRKPQTVSNIQWPKELHSKLLETYRNVLPDCLGKIETACKFDDWKDAAFWAHRLKSSSRYLNYASLADLCEQLEYGVEDGLSTSELLDVSEKLKQEGYQILASLSQNHCEQGGRDVIFLDDHVPTRRI